MVLVVEDTDSVRKLLAAGQLELINILKTLPAPPKEDELRKTLAESRVAPLVNRIAELVSIGFKNLHVLIGVAVEPLTNFGKRISWLYGVALHSAARRGSCLLRGLLSGLGERRIDC